MLSVSYQTDSLDCALSAIINYSSVQFGEDMEALFGSTYNYGSNCAGDSLYTIATSYDIYGSSRLGTIDAKVSREDTTGTYSRKLGAKTYELSNHLGNVMATVSDKKLHPQEYDGANEGYKAEVTAMYDYYPFGMEIASRSGDFNLVDYTQDEYISIYDGLLNNCLDYTPDNEKSYNCETATNVYNQTYVNEYTVEGEELKHFYVIIQMRLSEIIPNLDPNGVYIFNIMLNKSEGRQITATMDTATAVVLSPSLGGDAPVYDVIMSSDKMITLTYTGAGLQAFATNGKVKLEILAHENPLEENRSITISNIHIDQFKANMNIPIAMRVGTGYPYGMSGMSKDEEVSGSGNSYTTFYRGLDVRLGKWLSVDPKNGLTPWESPYASMGNNPIWFTDPLGDIFKIGTKDKQAKSDVKSLAKNDKNQDYIKFNTESGEVTLDFGNLKQSKVNRILKRDEGLSLISDLSTATNKDGDINFFYGTEGKTNVGLENATLQTNVPDYYSSVGKSEPMIYDLAGREVGINPKSQIINASITPYSSNGEKFGLKPTDNYDGKVFIANGGFYNRINKPTTKEVGIMKITTYELINVRLNRARIVYHELKENYLRTAGGKTYDEAHSSAGGIKNIHLYKK